MSISKSKRELQRNAARDLAAKLRLEIGFARELRSFFKDLRQDFRAIYVADGSVIIAKDYSDEMQAILKKQYRRIAREFSQRMTRQLKKNFEHELKEGEADAVAASIATMIVERAPVQAEYIMNTTQAELDAVIASVLADAEADGETLSREETAARAERALMRQQISRATTIAATETNAVAEESKEREALALIAAGAIVGGIAIADRTVKQWDSVLDEKTRINHAIADGQRRAVEDTFDVGGQRLARPGDTSHGATLDNIINCRCSMQYVIGDPTVL